MFGWRREGKSYKANLHGKSGVIGFWAGIAQPDRFYQSWKVAQNACLLHYFLVKWFLFESQDSTFEPFQEAACTVQKLSTMKNHWKMYHVATEVHPLTRPEMYNGRAFERHCAKYCSIATEKPCGSNSIITLNLRETPRIFVMMLIICPLSLTFRLARGVHLSALR